MSEKSIVGRGHGGARAGSGRKPLDTEHVHMKLRRNVRVQLVRLGNAHGIARELSPRLYWDRVLSALLEHVTTPEPEYLKLARREENH